MTSVNWGQNILIYSQPSGLLLYLDSEEDVPEDDVDRINTRDNLKLALEHENRKKRNIQWKMIEKQVDQMLQHWRARIGLKSRAVCTTLFQL